MSEPYFIVSPKDIYNKKFKITGREVKHIRKVLRLQPTEKVLIGNGEGVIYEGILEKVTNSFVTGYIVNYKEYTKDTIEITAVISLTKSKKIELIIQKLTELGIDEIYPLETAFSIVKGASIEKKYKRWTEIIKNAVQQSKNPFIPKLNYFITVEKLSDLAKDYDLKIVPEINENSIEIKKVLSTKKLPRKIIFVIGPEGGFSTKELSILNKWHLVTLGKSVLRMETASIYVLSILKFLFRK